MGDVGADVFGFLCAVAFDFSAVFGLVLAVDLDLVGLDLVGLDLVGLDLVGLDLIGLDLVGLDLAGLDLAAGRDAVLVFRLTVAVRDLVFALLLGVALLFVFADAFALDTVFFLVGTMSAP